MLYQRVITGLLFLPVFYLFAWKLPPSYFTALVIIAAAAGQHEFYRMAAARGARPLQIPGIACGALLILDAYRPLLPELGPLFIITMAVLLIMVVRLFSPRPVEGALEDVASTALGMLYVAVLFAFLVAIRLSADGRQWLVFLFFTIWASDIGAYSIGIPFGRHRLYEKISPKKSIEGLGGAVFAAAGMALICRIWFMPPVSAAEVVCVAVVLALVGTVGDLTESMFKRAAKIKDSGVIIPGHGGMLDRMDSMLFAAPVLYYYIRMR
ncbi:MAG TPA: phosphatidate cytidylyltransferase [Nitrospirota bacterium]|nr:phosphatidate cytidylyltransferase [Nitrospirota bacterium]